MFLNVVFLLKIKLYFKNQKKIKEPRMMNNINEINEKYDPLFKSVMDRHKLLQNDPNATYEDALKLAEEYLALMKAKNNELFKRKSKLKTWFNKKWKKIFH